MEGITDDTRETFEREYAAHHEITAETFLVVGGRYANPITQADYENWLKPYAQARAEILAEAFELAARMLESFFPDLDTVIAERAVDLHTLMRDGQYSAAGVRVISYIANGLAAEMAGDAIIALTEHGQMAIKEEP